MSTLTIGQCLVVVDLLNATSNLYHVHLSDDTLAGHLSHPVPGGSNQRLAIQAFG